MPRVATLETLNGHLVELCRNDLSRQLHGKPAPKQSLLEEERTCFLRPLPNQAFEACRFGQAHADSLSLVRFDTNSYSVPTKYAHRSITIVATIAEVRLIFEDRLIARHERHWGKQQYFFDPVHYLALLERKPGGFDHGTAAGFFMRRSRDRAHRSACPRRPHAVPPASLPAR